ncbi:hypothetical protein G6F49_013131 [Rhizopus delemar]|nr:hypothetical protein G6F49_013131 [Rhizopus delemar]
MQQLQSWRRQRRLENTFEQSSASTERNTFEVEAGEDLLAFLSFFVRALGHGMEIPTKISTARTMVNYSSASSGVSRFLVCSLCRSVFANNPHRQERPCGNSLFVGSSLKPVLEFPYNSIVETLKKLFVRPNFETEIEQWRGRYSERQNCPNVL